MSTQLVIDIDGKKVPFDKLPCAKCQWRYSIHCPKCDWNKDMKYNTYGGEYIDMPDSKVKRKYKYKEYILSQKVIGENMCEVVISRADDSDKKVMLLIYRLLNRSEAIEYIKRNMPYLKVGYKD